MQEQCLTLAHELIQYSQKTCHRLIRRVFSYFAKKHFGKSKAGETYRKALFIIYGNR
jgi:hypothetical protein